MAELVGSAVVGETVGLIFSSLTNKQEKKANGSDIIERLEMVHIKIEAAIEMSNKWCVTDRSLLYWRKKLKRAAQECYDTLHRCKQHALEEEEIEQGLRQLPFPKRIAHTTKSFFYSFITRHSNESTSSVVPRFEKFAADANEFVRYVESGGIARQLMSIDPLIRHLLAGKCLSYKMSRGSKLHSFDAYPRSFDEHGLLVNLEFNGEDREVLDEYYFLELVVRLSESTDIVGTIIKCLQSITPHFKPIAEATKKELIQLPTQDFSNVADVASRDAQLQVDILNSYIESCRPNPFCCKEYEDMPCSGHTNTLESSNIFPEPVIMVLLRRWISPVEVQTNLLQDFPPLEISALFEPHYQVGTLHPAQRFVQEEIDGEEQHDTPRNVSLYELEEMFLSKAIDFLYQADKGTKYFIRQKSKHGLTCFGATKESIQKRSG